VDRWGVALGVGIQEGHLSTIRSLFMLGTLKIRARKAINFLRIGLNLDARLASIDQQMQKQLLAQLRQRCAEDPTAFGRALNDFGFRVYSQFEEDGLLLYIFAAIGFQTKRVVEICAGDGRECMATNLIISHQFDGLLFDGNERLVNAGQKFFACHKDTFQDPPSFQKAWITTKNINDLLIHNGFTGDIDLLSLDMDGVDYWIWKALEVVRPRVCLFETNNHIPSELSLTVPYSDAFDSSWQKPPPQQYFRGVSLKAMSELSKRKGYRLIGAHRHGFNVFFLRDDVGVDVFPAVTVEQAHDNPLTRKSRLAWPSVKDFHWVSV
jgi:hypothetical protein